MSENIKVREKDKRVFDMLQAEFTLKTGKKVTQQELFSRIIDFTKSRRENFFGRLLKLPLSEKEAGRFRELQSDWGVVTREEDVDRALYGIEA
jgi:hypothetical protein